MPRKAIRRCRVEGCKEECLAAGLCRRHYHRLRRTGTTELRPNSLCSVKGCERPYHCYDRHMWAKHPYVVLHELAHAFHDQVLSFGEPAIIDAYKDAKEKGIYEKVLLYTGATVRHYGLSNHKEYFAESTEAYFGVNDSYPFVRAELKKHDPAMFSLMERFWGPVR